MKAISLQPTALLLLAAPVILHAAPVELGRESFETAPGIGYTTSVAEFDDPSVARSDFFGKFPNDGARTRGVISGGDGANVFMGEDLDYLTNLNADPNATQFLTTNSFSIAGKINTSVKILLAAPGTGPDGIPPAAQTQNHYDHDATVANVDFVRVEASVDGGPFTRLIQFSPNVATLNQPLSLDADGNYLGGGLPVLNASFQEFDLPITTGNTVQVRVVMHTNATNEYIVVDNIRIFGETAATAPPSIAGVPGTALIFNEGSPAQTLAPALTVTDADSASLASAVVTISTNHSAAEDVLAATPSGAIGAGDIVFNSSAGTLTITRSASLADYQAVLRSVTYRNTNATNPNTAPRQISFRVNDSANNSNQPIRTVEITDAIQVQNVPFIESFETDGRGTRYALEGRFNISPAFFDRVSLSGVTNGDGTFGIAAEDTVTDAAPVKAASFLLNTAGLVNLTATVRLAAPAGSVYDANDFIMIEASVNGGAFTTVGNFRSTGNLNFPMAQDTNADNVGDGTQLTAALQDFTFSLPSATTLGLRVRFQSNSLGERLVADRISVNGTAVEFSINSVSSAENAGAQVFTVTRNVSSGPDTVTYATAGNTASSGDFTAATSTVSFADGETTKPIIISISPDNIVEMNETFTVVLSNPSRGTITGGPGTGTITNDDSSVVSLTGGTVVEGDTGTAPINFAVQLSNPVDVPVTFNRATLSAGTAASGTDFTAVPSTVTVIPALSTSGSFNVNAIGDHLPESLETVNVELSALAASGRAVTFAGGGATTVAAGGIQDDDPLIVAGTGGVSMGIGSSGKLTVASLLAQATGGEGRPLSLVGVQAGPTAGGGTVSIVDGWINYKPAPGFSGADSFTYTISDGFQTVTGTVNVIASSGIGQTVNILSIAPQGPGNVMVALGIPGRTYRWQTSSNLITWTNLGSAVVCPASGVISQVDPGPLPPTRFYRMVQP